MAAFATRLTSFIQISLQKGQTKMSCSGRTPNFEIVRERFIVSPQERHTRVYILSCTIEGVQSDCGMRGSSATDRSAIALIEIKRALSRRCGFVGLFIARAMSSAILICTIGSAKNSFNSGGQYTNNFAISAWCWPGLPRKSRFGLFDRRAIGYRPFCPPRRGSVISIKRSQPH